MHCRCGPCLVPCADTRTLEDGCAKEHADGWHRPDPCWRPAVWLMPAAAKFAYQEGANALMVMLGRSVGGLAILLLFIHATGRSPNVTLGNLRRATLAGVSHTFATVGILASIVYIDISLASIILFLYPFPIAIIAHFRGETPLSAPIILLMLLATAGLALVLGSISQASMCAALPLRSWACWDSR